MDWIRFEAQSLRFQYSKVTCSLDKVGTFIFGTYSVN